MRAQEYEEDEAPVAGFVLAADDLVKAHSVLLRPSDVLAHHNLVQGRPRLLDWHYSQAYMPKMGAYTRTYMHIEMLQA